MSQLSWRQISSANLGFAFPEKTLMPPVVLIASKDDNDLWLGRVDSNQRMPVPKTGALPLGYAPVSDCRLISCKYSLRDRVWHANMRHFTLLLRLSRA